MNKKTAPGRAEQKNLFMLGHGVGHGVATPPHQNNKRFFGSFLQERTASILKGVMSDE
jgi:hypothetical protein